MIRIKTQLGHEGHSLVTNKLVMVSKNLFRKHSDLITRLIGNSPGVYALYDGADLYYVGKSTDLQKRVRAHLRDRHLSSWTHFSLYLVRREEHIREIESLLIEIATPKGNRAIPKGRSTGSLVKKLELMLVQKQKEEREDLFGLRKKLGSKSRVPRDTRVMGLVKRDTFIYRTYRDKEYRGVLHPDGTITLNGKVFKSLSAAAGSLTKGEVNGWVFWSIRNADGEWVKLTEFRGDHY